MAVIINGTDVTNKTARYTIRSDFNRISILDLIVKGIDYEIGQEVEITNKFKGYIVSMRKGRTYTQIKAFDKLDEMKDKFFSNIWENTRAEDIVKAIVEEADLTYWRTPTTETPEITKFIMREDDILRTALKLSQVSGNWYLWYNPEDDKIYFTPPDYLDNGVTITIGTDGRVIGKWDKNDTKMINKVIFRGGRKHTRKTETFSGDGSTTDFVVSYPPEDVRVKVDGTEMKQGEEGISTSYDYTIDKDNRTIVFTSAPASGSSIEVDYSYSIGIKIEVPNETSINNYGTYAKVFTDRDVTNMADARRKAVELATKSDVPTYKAKIITSQDVRVGEKVHIVDDSQNIDDTFIVISKEERLGASVIRITVSSYDYFNTSAQDIAERVKKLEEEAENNDVVQKYRLVQEQEGAKQRVEITVKYRPINGSLKWNNPDAKWDTQGVFWGKVYPLILDDPVYGMLDTRTNIMDLIGEDYQIHYQG